MGRWPPPTRPPRPSPPHPHPTPSPTPSQHHSIPSTRPPDRSSSRAIRPKYPTIMHCFNMFFATNHGGLTLIESAIILFAKHFCFVHTTHTPCCHHCTAMFGSAVLGNLPYPITPTPPPPPPTTGHRTPHTRTITTYKWTIICFNKTRLFRT